MEPEEAERWIVFLIRNGRLDAKIDSEKNKIVMATQPPNVYQQVSTCSRRMDCTGVCFLD